MVKYMFRINFKHDKVDLTISKLFPYIVKLFPYIVNYLLQVALFSCIILTSFDVFLEHLKIVIYIIYLIFYFLSLKN